MFDMLAGRAELGSFSNEKLPGCVQEVLRGRSKVELFSVQKSALRS